jgi:hypothetical protein
VVDEDLDYVDEVDNVVVAVEILCHILDLTKEVEAAGDNLYHEEDKDL